MSHSRSALSLPELSAGLNPAEEYEIIERWIERVAADPDWQKESLAEALQELACRHLRLLRQFDRVTKISDRQQTDIKSLAVELRKQSLTDPLTSLPNRRHMVEHLAQAVRQAERYGTVFSLVAIDLDHFKRVNDAFGHAVGDELLRQVAASLRHALRHSDICARWGGDEFLVLLPMTDAAAAGPVAEKLREAMAGAISRSDQGSAHVSGSLGVASYRPGRDVDGLMQAADAALYVAKAKGRDCCAGEEELGDTLTTVGLGVTARAM